MRRDIHTALTRLYTMVRVLVSYYSESRNTGKLAKAIASGAEEVPDVEYSWSRLTRPRWMTFCLLTPSDGSPTYYGLLMAPSENPSKVWGSTVDSKARLELHSHQQNEQQPELKLRFYPSPKHCLYAGWDFRKRP
jgi:hypothetical protein